MRLLAASLLLLTSSCSLFGGSSSLNAHGGLRALSSDVATVGEAPVYGIEGSLGLTEHWGVEASIWTSREEGDDLGGGVRPELETDEYALGLRRTFLPDSPVKLHAGAGVSWLDATLDGPAAASADGVGAYAHLGAAVAILMFDAGVDLRGTLTGVEVGGEDLNHLQATVFVGFTF